MVQRSFASVPLKWQIPAALLLVGCLIGAAMTMGIVNYVDGPPLGLDTSDAESTVLNAAQPPLLKAGPVTRAATNEDLVAAALTIKPIEDLQKYDRVIYEGGVCQWRSWGKNDDTSVIKCSDKPAFSTQTIRLTPVESKATATR